MFCRKCGAEIAENTKFCSSCGAQVRTEENTTNEEQTTNVETPSVAPVQTKSKFSGLAIAGFVLSLVGLIILGIPCGILGIVFTSVSFKEIATKNLKGKGLAIAGLVVSICDVVLTLALL